MDTENRSFVGQYVQFYILSFVGPQSDLRGTLLMSPLIRAQRPHFNVSPEVRLRSYLERSLAEFWGHQPTTTGVNPLNGSNGSRVKNQRDGLCLTSW